ncbi:MAG: hypothetical protein JXC32_19150 [Anaerolineae bacterium]|nr:hypothetical protein [Anaerolineae bacterium]
MERDANLPVTLTRLADQLRACGLGDIAGSAVDILRVWGFVGSQILWMAMPLIGEATFAPVAETLEDPEALAALRTYLVRQDGAVTGSAEGE